jgi:cyanophycinase
VLNIKTREEANAIETYRALTECRCRNIYWRRPAPTSPPFLAVPAFHHLLLEKYWQQNFLIAGTSAGAAASSNNMIYQGSSHEALA